MARNEMGLLPLPEWEIKTGDALAVLRELPDESVQCCVTSPPYWGLRDYGDPGQLGLESTPEEYVAKLVEVFREVRRVLRGDGTLWLNLGDSYTSGGRDGHGTRVGYKQQTNRGMSGEADPERPPQPPASSRRIWSASPGAWPSRSRPTAGGCVPTSSGRSQTRCLRA